MKTNIVSIRDLWVCRGENAVLEDINLQLEEADFLGLIGPNGGGKSTLLKVMLGLIKPDRGEIRIFGQEPQAARGRVGYMPQKTVFDQNFPVKVLDVVLMGRYSRTGLFHRYGRQDREAAFKALQAVGMSDRAEREIGALSGGEQQRVFVARSLVSDPELLLLDEPTAGVDSAQQTEFYDLLCHLNHEAGNCHCAGISRCHSHLQIRKQDRLLEPAVILPRLQGDHQRGHREGLRLPGGNDSAWHASSGFEGT